MNIILGFISGILSVWLVTSVLVLYRLMRFKIDEEG